ncbi:MAG: cyclic nucleotide-binding domain-containing protein [Spirochaetaceae bacterium]|nr:cyclic nucleotide-binding domain-containing protein [Spirochaetaceae bacterium]
MEYIVASCSDKVITEKIRKVVEEDFPNEFLLQFPTTEKAILERLNFELPELVIVNFSDEGLSSDYLRDQILDDSWLHNFGIVGLYDRKKDREENIIEANKDINLLTLMDYSRIESHLGKTLRIINSNRQLIFQGFLADKLVNRMTGSFQIDNHDYLVAPVYGGLLAVSLVRMGKIPEEDRHGVQMALSELILNSIEHGNCGISYSEKSEWLATGEAINELIIERCKDPKVARKKVTLDWDIGEESCRFTIKDEGKGFDVLAFRDKLKSDANDRLHGRGIVMAQMVADKLLYNKAGTQVSISISLKKQVENAAPAGFREEEVLKVKAGDTLMRAGEFGDCIYYISSGKYTVYHRDNPVGRITPADIFMGEMAFLLNNARSATVVADTPGQVIRIPRKSFIEVVKNYPQYSIFLSKILAQKLVRSNENVAAEQTVAVQADCDDAEPDFVDVEISQL